MTSCVVVLLGLPGAGKTSTGRKLCSELMGTCGISVKMFSFDDLVPLQRQAEFVSMEDMKVSRKFMLDEVDKFITDIENCVVVVDDNNYYRSMRHEYYVLAAKHKVGFCQIFLQCDVETALRNNARRGAASRIPDAVVRRMAEKFEVPQDNWENPFLSIDFKQTEEKLGEIITVIQSARKNPVLLYEILAQRDREREESRQICSRNSVHKADQILRKEIQKIILENPTEAKRLAPSLNQNRKIILEKIKNGDFYKENEEDFHGGLIGLLRNNITNK